MSAIGELRNLKGSVAPTKKQNKAAFWFLLPWFVGLFVVTVGPMLASLVLGFTKYNLLQPPEFNGLNNITRMIGDERLHKSLGVTFTYV
ncbi:hypothetical protein ACC691_36130, partial [Rhizobium johnstonii]